MKTIYSVLVGLCCVWAVAQAGEPHVSIRLVPAGSLTSSAGKEAKPETGIPAMPFNLKQNTPDPFDSVTTIPFSVYESVPVRLEVLSMAGDTLAVLVDAVLAAGEHSIEFDGSALADGLYQYRLVSGVYTASRTMIKNFATGVRETAAAMPVVLSPNPCLGELRISLAPQTAGDVTVGLFSSAGGYVATLFSGRCEAGSQVLTVSPDAAAGTTLAAGQYWCRITSADGTVVLPLVLVR